MKEFKEARERYEATPIPEELDQRVRAGIRQGRSRYRARRLRRSLGAAAACFVVVFGALNLSPTVAAAAADLPVLGARLGAALFALVPQVLPLPVVNNSCVHNRSVGEIAPPEQLSFDELMDWYAGELLHQMPCMRMVDNLSLIHS